MAREQYSEDTTDRAMHMLAQSSEMQALHRVHATQATLLQVIRDANNCGQNHGACTIAEHGLL